ncbi:MAG: hypothetical protein Hyperionvirus4_106 [Hyperionvirus sp.]|uniref:Uncharacterized protein n=1 Tax=Hyperionvirus sp. TaxID=2487770 RepID=A0A3G5AA91_9VIRU|nr:MAG: hypothetical protein Hyperionvirus4_106 [Hyperionvirus sp.]
MTSIHQLKTTAANALDHLLIPSIISIIGEYYLESVALIFHGTGVCGGDYEPDVICYKAMDILEWNSCVEEYLKNKSKYEYKSLQFSFNAYRTLRDIFECIKISNDNKLKAALDIIYPKYIGTDIDVFYGLKSILLEGKSGNEDDAAYFHVWQHSSRQWLIDGITN